MAPFGGLVAIVGSGSVVSHQAAAAACPGVGGGGAAGRPGAGGPAGQPGTDQATGLFWPGSTTGPLPKHTPTDAT